MSLARDDWNHFNLSVWESLSQDPTIAALPYRIETNEFGQIVMSPLPNLSHGRKQGRVASLLDQLIPSGEVITECPISTRKGVKGADVAWCNDEQWLSEGEKACFETAPSICVEILSPSNTDAEMDEKKELYFEQGASEVWLVKEDTTIEFFHQGEPDAAKAASMICPQFPGEVD